jgi:SPP1 family predicted phage head-tail adaptor
MAAIIIGEMRHSITIKALGLTKDAYGSMVESYRDLMTIRAAVKFQSGTKSIDNNEIFTSQTLQFITHYRATVTATCRILYEGQLYRINSIDVIGYKDGLVLNSELIND